MSTLVMVAETMCVLHSKIKIRIVGMKWCETNKWWIHFEEFQPIVHIIICFKWYFRKIWHYVQLGFSRRDHKHATKTDRLVSIFGFQYFSDCTNEIIISCSFRCLDFDHFARFAFGNEKISQQTKLWAVWFEQRIFVVYVQLKNKIDVENYLK